MRSKQHSGIEEEIKITPQSIIYKGVEYPVSEVKITFYNRTNTMKGRTLILFTIISYIIAMSVILNSPIYTMFFDYMFFIYFPWGVSFLYLVFRIYMNYIIEYVIVEFGESNEKLFKVNNKKNSNFIELLNNMSSSITFVDLGKGFRIV